MKHSCFAALLLALLTPAAIAHAAAPIHVSITHTKPPSYMIPRSEIMPLDKIHAGMEGYGLTVFQGTKISRFHVKVVNVIHKWMAGRDVILCRMSGGPITERGANIMEGMSGSPIYLKGKLAGAVAFGFEFPKEPVAMVTPIESMADAFNPRLPTKPQFSALPWSREPARFMAAGFNGTTLSPANTESSWIERMEEAAGSLGFSEPGAYFSADAGVPLTPHPLITPLFARGLNPRLVASLGRIVAPFGLKVASGVSGSDVMANSHTALVPGAMVGVYLCTGDVELGAYGTVTYRKGNRILAFGHPFQQLGPVDFPISTASVSDIWSSLKSSMKLPNSGPVVGSLEQDTVWSVMGVVGRKPHTVPLTVSVNDEQTGRDRTFHINCVDHPLFTSLVADSAAQEAVSEVRNYPGDSMADVRVEVQPVGMAPIIRTNTYFDYFAPNSFGMPALADMDRILDLLQSNPFHPVKLSSIKLSFKIHPGRQMSSIERIAVSKTDVSPGDLVHTDVTLRPWKGQPYVVPMDVRIPSDSPNGPGTLMISGGMLSPIPSAPSAGGGGFTIVLGGGSRSTPEPAANLQEMIDRYVRTEKNTDLVARVVQSSSPSLNIGGERLYNLPPALASVLHSPRATGAYPLPDEAKTILPMPQVILGAQGIAITIARHESGGSPSGHVSVPAVVPHPTPGIPVAPAPKPVAGKTSITDSAPLIGAIGRSGIRRAADEEPDPDDPSLAAGPPRSGDLIVPPSMGSPTPPSTLTARGTATLSDTSTSSAASASSPESGPETVGKKVQNWTLHTAADFETGRGDGIAPSSDDALVLAPRFQRIRNLEKDAFVWTVRPTAGGSYLLGTGNNGRVYRLSASGKLTTALQTPELDILALTVAPDGTAYAGTAPHGYIYKIPAADAAGATGTASDNSVDPAEVNTSSAPTPFFRTGRNYVLCVAVGRDGWIYAGASGGAIYKISRSGVGSLWKQTDESHICSLDITPSGDILAGTSPSGLVYRITPEGQSSVIWDSGDTSVSSVVAMPNGDVLAGTAPKGEIVRIDAGTHTVIPVVKTDSAIHDMVRVGNDAIAASGNILYQILPSNTVRRIQNSEDSDILSVGASADGSMLAGTGNIAAIYSIRSGEGSTYRTVVKDAGTVSRWGHLRWEGDAPSGSSVSFETRSGNNEIPDSSWTSWTPTEPADNESTVGSPAARYVQVRMQMSASPQGASPTVRSVSLTYVPENRPPTISVTSPAAGSSLHGKVALQWTGQDPDGDALLYRVAYSTDNGATWKPADLRDKDAKSAVPFVTTASANWDTTSLKDGSYLVKITVSDIRSNPDKPLEDTAIIGPVIVVNNAPKVLMADTNISVGADRVVRFHGAADGHESPIVSVSYRVDGGPWFLAAAEGGLFDSPQVSFRAETEPLPAGDHKIEIEAVNAAGAKTTTTLAVKASGTASVLPAPPTEADAASSSPVA